MTGNRGGRGGASRAQAAACRGIACLALLCALLAAGCGSSYKHVANIDAPGELIVAFGDSITRGFGASPDRDYPARLAGLLGQPVLNAGVDGDTTASGLRRLERDVLAHNPRVVIVGLGGNDFLRRVSRDEVFRNLDEIVGAVVANGAIPVIVHSKFGVLTDPYYKGYRDVADRHGAVLVRNSLRGILGTRSRMHDQIHPNDAGYELLAERVAEVLGPLLEAADKARAGSS